MRDPISAPGTPKVTGRAPAESSPAGTTCSRWVRVSIIVSVEKGFARRGPATAEGPDAGVLLDSPDAPSWRCRDHSHPGEGNGVTRDFRKSDA